MSQEKVDRYKEYKANKQKIWKKDSQAGIYRGAGGCGGSSGMVWIFRLSESQRSG